MAGAHTTAITWWVVAIARVEVGFPWTRTERAAPTQTNAPCITPASTTVQTVNQDMRVRAMMDFLSTGIILQPARVIKILPVRFMSFNKFFFILKYQKRLLVSVNIQCQASIYTLSLCRGHSWRVRLSKQETLTPPGHLVSPLVCRGPWMSTVVLYCKCHSNSASVLLYFTFFVTLVPFAVWSW